MSIADKLKTIAGNEGKVYNAGYNKGYADGSALNAYYDEFWDSYQLNGTRTDYSAAFVGHCWEEGVTFNPKYDIIPTNAYMMFSRWSTAVKDIPAFNAKGGAIIDLTQIGANGGSHMFYANNYIEHIGEVGNENVRDLTAAFTGCTNLRKIDGITMSESYSYPSGLFSNCKSLEEVTFRSILKYNLELNYSTLLTHDSLVGIINQLYDWSGTTTTRTLYVGAKNKAKLTNEEIAIATQKGWTVGA